MPLRAALLPALAAAGLAVGAAPAAAADHQSRHVGYEVDQETPHCGPRICVHWVATTEDAPSLDDADADGVPDYVELTLAEWEAAMTYELGTLGWAEPPGDGGRGGGTDLVDVYLLAYNGQAGATFEYELSPDGKRAPGYAFVDQDFAEYAAHFRRSLVRGIAAHELNHLLQFGTDVRQEHWFLEATATTTEEPFAPALNSWVSYARRWGQTTEQPIDRFDHSKAYGTGAFLMWLQSLHGEDVVAEAWRRSLAAGSRAVAALDGAIRARGGDGFQAAFAAFAAEAAEWRRPAMALPDRALLTDAERVGSLVPDGGEQTIALDHLTLRLLDVPPPAAADAAELTVAVPAGVSGALALVGRTAEADTGEAEIALARLPEGGSATVTLAQPARFARITAVLVNADPRVVDAQGNPWPADGASFRAGVRLIGAPASPPPAPPEEPPPPVPPPTEVPTLRESVLTGPLTAVAVARRVRRARAARGLPIGVVVDRPAALTVSVRAGRRVLGRAVRSLRRAGRHTVQVRVRGLSRRRRTVLTVVLTARGSGGIASTERRRVVVVP